MTRMSDCVCAKSLLVAEDAEDEEEAEEEEEEEEEGESAPERAS